MTNAAIADHLELLAKLMEIHGDDSFRAKSYASAAFTIDKLPTQVANLEPNEMFAIKGIGAGTGKKVQELIQTGHIAQLTQYLEKTPPGILELLNIKGLGPKKIATLWKDLGVETIGELLYACEENRLLLYKGFGAKTQQNIKEAIDFYLSKQGTYLFAQVEEFAKDYTEKLRKIFPANKIEPAGDIKRHNEVIHKVEWVTDVPGESIRQLYTNEEGYEVIEEEDRILVKGREKLPLEFTMTSTENVISKAVEKSCSSEFFEAWKEEFGDLLRNSVLEEKDFFEGNKFPFIPAFYRESASAIEQAKLDQLPSFIQPGDIKGIIHTHSDWSDGVNTIEDMAKAAIQQGFEYLVISDHSQAAYYAKGLFPERIVAQHELIDELNEKLKPFKIFKSIEADILSDGSLDYNEEILSSFDLVIASVHSNLKMSKEKAMPRLLAAIANPFTTILGHMTGRLLISRNGYEVDHNEIIEACAKHNVVIELNANPRRLDMDRRYIQHAINKGVLISIDPDAHSINSFKDIRYGVLSAQKGGLTAQHNLSSFSLQEFDAFLEKQKSKRLTKRD